MNSWRNESPSGLGNSGKVSLKLARDHSHDCFVRPCDNPLSGIGLACNSQSPRLSMAHSTSTGVPIVRSTSLTRCARERMSCSSSTGLLRSSSDSG